MLFYGPDTLLQPLYRILNLAIGDVDERACFSELFLKEGSILGMAPVEMHLKSFGNKVRFVREPLLQNTSMPFGVREISSKRVGRCSDELLDLRERFSVHDLLEKTGEV